jgi:hypothetical protein
MGNFIGKLLNSSGTLAILSIVALGIWMSNLDTKIAVPKKIQGRPIEEIIQDTANNTQEPAWDNDFKSSVIKDAQ